MAIDNTNTIVRAKFETALEMAYGSITDSLTMIGTPFTASFSIVFIQNFTDQILDFSISYAGDSVTFSLAPGGSISTDMITNAVAVSQGEAAWVQYRTDAPTLGFVQVSSVTPV